VLDCDGSRKVELGHSGEEFEFVMISKGVVRWDVEEERGELRAVTQVDSLLQ
jgi:hypothetical protein